MVKQPVKPFLLIDIPRTLPVTQLNVPVANLLKFLLGSKAERYKANSFFFRFIPLSLGTKYLQRDTLHQPQFPRPTFERTY